MKHRKVLLILIIFLLVNGCATIKSVKSSKISQYKGKFEKIYLLVNISENPIGYASSLAYSLKIQFEERNIQCIYQIDNNMSLVSKKEIETEISDFDPKLILTIGQSFSGSADNGNFLVTLSDAKTEDVLWKASTQIGFSVYNIPPSSEQVGEKIIEQMIDDGLLEN